VALQVRRPGARQQSGRPGAPAGHRRDPLDHERDQLRVVEKGSELGRCARRPAPPNPCPPMSDTRGYLP